MIFISYRREDTKQVVTNLYERLVKRYGSTSVFVDFNDIPPGSMWPDVLRDQLAQCRILLAVVGEMWGDIRFESGKMRGRMRLEDKADWVRVELCTGVQRANRKDLLLVVVSVDEAALPETEWECELDQLPKFQQAKLRSLSDFGSDFERLCQSLEDQVPDLKQRAARVKTQHQDEGPPPPRIRIEVELKAYVDSELRATATIQLPLILPDGNAVVEPLAKLRIDLPLIVSHELTSTDAKNSLRWLGIDPLAIHEEFRNSHTSSVLVDRASRFDDTRRDRDLPSLLKPGARLVILGDPGCGKTTLLQWLANRYGIAATGTSQQTPEDGLPQQDWFPLLIRCRELLEPALPTSFAEMLTAHFCVRQFAQASELFAAEFLTRAQAGKLLLLIDGLDEIPQAEARLRFAAMLDALANRYPNLTVILTSRVVGFQAVRETLAARFDHLLVGPLDLAAKRAFVERWGACLKWSKQAIDELVTQVCHSRVTAKLTDNVFLLALVSQLRVVDQALPDRRVDVYRRAVEIMIQRARPFSGPKLVVNEVIPHLEFLAYSMRQRGIQRITEREATEAFDSLRKAESQEPGLLIRESQTLLKACIESVGLLTIAGTETDSRGYERQVVQFFHQSFQEYFAGQAIKYGRGVAGGAAAPANRFRELLASIAIRQREVSIFGQYKLTEPVIADNWQEVVRMGIADLPLNEADAAIRMLMPGPTTPKSEARARAIFALQCLADEPPIREATVEAVFEAVVDSLTEGDGFNTKLNTWMDEALAACAQSRFGPRQSQKLIESFCQSRGERRQIIGSCWTLRHPKAEPKSTADELLALAKTAGQTTSQTERVGASLELMNRCFLLEGKLAFLTLAQRETVISALLVAAERDDASALAAAWALCWVTGGLTWNRNETQSDGERIRLSSVAARRLETLLAKSKQEPFAASYGCQCQYREEGVIPIWGQQDWIYELAVIADGGKPRRALPTPRPTGRTAPVDWMLPYLGASMPPRISAVVACVLGGFGVFRDEMAAPLAFGLKRQSWSNTFRDEAMLGLAMLGSTEATRTLIEAADTAPVGDDDFLYTRGLFGLLYLDNVEVLAQQIRKAQPHADLVAYCHGLAGSNDSRGQHHLTQLVKNSNERIRTAARKVLGGNGEQITASHWKRS